jgi:hypothetical protein
MARGLVEHPRHHRVAQRDAAVRQAVVVQHQRPDLAVRPADGGMRRAADAGTGAAAGQARRRLTGAVAQDRDPGTLVRRPGVQLFFDVSTKTLLQCRSTLVLLHFGQVVFFSESRIIRTTSNSFLQSLQMYS